MKNSEIRKIFNDTAYVRMGGSERELQCANYIANLFSESENKPVIESFEVPMATIKK